jgi:hypothetical protein
VQRRENESDAQNMSDWFQGLGVGGTHGSFRITVTRTDPTMHKGVRVGGHLRHYDNEFIDESVIAANHGGGKFMVKVHVPGATGGWLYHKAKQVEIAGEPKLPDEGKDEPDVGTAMAGQAFTVMKEALADARQGSRSNGADGETIARAVAAATAPFQATLQMMQGELAAARQSATEARQVQADPVRDKLLSKMVEDDSARITAIRVAHESEIRQLRQSATDTEALLRSQFNRDLERQERQGERQMDTLKSSYESQIMTMKHTYEGQIATLKESHARELSSITMMSTTTDKIGAAESKRFERENAELRAEVKALREKKDKSIFEQVKEMGELKEILGVGDEKEQGVIERVLETLANSKAAIGLASKLAGGDAPAVAPPPTHPQLPPPFTPFRAEDGKVYTHDGQGNLREVARKKKVRPPAPPPQAPVAAAPTTEGPAVPMTEEQLAAQAAQVAQAQAEQQAAYVAQQQEMVLREAMGELSSEDVALAVGYLESAYRGSQEPKMVAQSLRSQGLVPTSLFGFIRDQGVDVLLDKVARLEASSPLATQKGRNWVRSVARGLIEA